ncbi:MAG: hypothetical protein AAF480_19535 [Actinomycetota bacterium]
MAAFRPLADVAAELTAPFGLEDIATSPIPVVAADLTGDATSDEALEHALASVRAVTVAVVDEASSLAATELAERFDIVLAPPGAVGAVVETADASQSLATLAAAAQRNPHAVVALVELLRIGA